MAALSYSTFGAVTILFIFLVLHSSSASINGGFSVKLIHRDSPNSPFSKTHSKSLNKAFRRSMRPIFYPNSAQSQIRPDNGQYLLKISIGNPPFDVYGIADTGSDLVWTQCERCPGCYKQINPKFDPKKSSSYKDLSCDAQECHTIGTGTCSPQHTCNYTYAYGSADVTQGVLAKETITVTSTSGKATSLRNIVFGCGHNNTGTFNENEMGIIGLGGGDLSLVSQLSPLVGGKKFSFCLVPFHTDPRIESKISFGKGSEVFGDGVVSTPLVVKEDKTPYFVTLKGISVGDKLVPFSSSSGKASKGNMFMDTGTPPTLIPQDFYDRLVAEVRSQIPMTPIGDDPSLGTQLCYKSKTNLEGPILTVHFEGADVKLTPIQTFIPPKDEVFCFAMQSVPWDHGIYGNFAQSNFLIGYDLEKMVAFFMPTDCTKD